MDKRGIEQIMNIAYFGNIVGHGTALSQWGTGFIILASRIDFVKSIDIFCQRSEDSQPMGDYGHKIRIFESFRPNKPINILSILSKFKRSNYDLIIFNLIPTTFGNRNTTNIISLLMPLMTKYLTKKNVRMIYHNSIITNDPGKLGYSGIFNRLRISLLRQLEIQLFRRVDVQVLLRAYKTTIDTAVPKNKVEVFEPRYLEGIPSLHINKNLTSDIATIRSTDGVPRVLLYGHWGPQKDLELALKSLQMARELNLNFHLTIGGGLNANFPKYKVEFDNLLESHSNIINSYTGFVPEKDVQELFLQSDVLLMPYNTPGGQSGVLETAALFGLDILAIDFPEYRERAEGNERVTLCEKEKFANAVISYLKAFSPALKSDMHLTEKIRESETKIRIMLEDVVKQ